MKILELNLLAFGPFTNVLLDLSGGHEGLHVVYGRNEDGKTSSLRAIKALLYGIPPNTADNFLHDNQALRLGGRLRLSNGSEISFLRRKGTKRTLLSPDGNNPLNDRALENFLGGVGEQVFATMFGISHDILVSGGQDLLQGGGEVGQSLFAAGLGATGLPAFLKEMEGEMRALFLPSGANPVINQSLTAYKRAKLKVNELSLPGREWAKHRQALEEAQNRRAEVTARLSELSKEKSRLERLEKTLPKISRRIMLLDRLGKMDQVVLLSAEFSEERREAMEALRPAEIGYARVLGELERLEQLSEELKIPEALLRQAEIITALHRRLGAHLKAKQDLPGLEENLLGLEAKAMSHLSKLRPDLNLERVEEIRLTSAARLTIQELAGRCQALETKLDRARQDEENAQRQLNAAKTALQEMAAVRNPSELNSAVVKARKKGNLEGVQQRLQEDLDKQESQLLVNLQRLGLWSGPLEELEKLPIPVPETVNRFESLLGNQETEAGRLDEKIAEVRGEEVNFEQQLVALRLTGEVPSEQELIEARKDRDQGWQLIRRGWLLQEDVSQEAAAYDKDHELASAYEIRVASADDISDRLRREAERVAAQANLVAALETRKQFLKELSEQRTVSQQRLAEIQGEWDSLWKTCGIIPLPPREMRAWLNRHQHLAQGVEILRELQRQLDGVTNEIATHQAQLTKALKNLQEPEPKEAKTLEALLDICQLVVTTIQDNARQREGLQERIAELSNKLAQARQEKEAATGQLEKWQHSWSEAIRPLGLPDQASPAVVNVLLNEMEELLHSVDKIAGFRDRIAGIKRDAEQFQADVLDLVGRVAQELARLSPEQAAAELQAQLAKAQKDAAKLESLVGQIEEKKEFLEKTKETIEIEQKRLTTLCQQAGCRDYQELEAIEKKSQEFQSLQQEVAALEEQILEQSAGSSLEDFIQEAGTADFDAISGQVEVINQLIEQLESERSELDEQIVQERIELAKMDGNAQAAEEAESAQEILAKMRVEVEHYLRLRLSWLILHKEIERYREENQGALIKKAADLFKILTLGSFSSLMVDYNEKDIPILQGVRPTGERVGVEGMSDGTVDPLYLSLRLATLEQYMETHEPMPFVVDDILIKLDDYRAKATLKVLHELSQRTQVIFFTHHQHLLELAQQLNNDGNIIMHQLN
ncbi:MAG: AAA family ATPase [Deltaproteobacteria bacterium]|nr:AAA family ATPase [Deltaproteobacteria bacterium]